MLRHPLLVAALQLLAVIILAYVGTERWQRWRQRRDFQYRTMSKLSEASTELYIRLADMLAAVRGTRAESASAECQSVPTQGNITARPATPTSTTGIVAAHAAVTPTFAPPFVIGFFTP